MNSVKWNIIWMALVGGMFLSNVWTWINSWIDSSCIINTQNKIKWLVDDIFYQCDNNKFAKIYNPMNPDWIETDDWYIYIV